MLGLILCGTMAAQGEIDVESVSQQNEEVAAPVATTSMRFAYVDVDSVMRAMPQYAEAQNQLAILRTQYAKEAEYNEQAFQRQFSEFLDGQKNFPEAILLKRQRDLQESMEKGIAFRKDCDRLLKAAEDELMAPIRAVVMTSITLVGKQHQYALILPCKPLYADTALYEDATQFVIRTAKARFGN